MASKTKLYLTINFYRIYFNSIGKLFPKNSAQLLSKIFSTPHSNKLRKREEIILKSAIPSTHNFASHKIKVYQWGKGNKIVYLIHGWEGNAGSLGAFAIPLVQKGYHIISFDGPAHGLSNGKTTKSMSGSIK